MARPVLTIDLDAIAANWRALNMISGRAETAAAVKADGYGLGVGPVASARARAGCQDFFVATADEGLELRASLPAASIWVLNGCSPELGGSSGLRPCLNTADQVAEWVTGGGGACALQTNSGMNRLGVDSFELPALLERHPALAFSAELVMSHLACSDTPDDPQNYIQLERFIAQRAILRPHLPKARFSLAATGGTQNGPRFHFDLVRCGVGLYGGLPFAAARPVVSLISPILQMRDIAPGEAVGYGNGFCATRPSRIATLPIGYADGLHRTLGASGHVYFDGQIAPIAGRVSMDLLTVDVTDIPERALASGAEIIGPSQSIDDLAGAAGTIGYEVLTSLGNRFERRYLGGASSAD